MESNRELEMGGITPDVQVYDIFHPTPVPLKELSAIAVSLEIWRCKANEYRDNRKLKEFHPSGERIVLKKMLPDLPTMIYTAIDKYVRRFGPSMGTWLKEHDDRILYYYYDHQNYVLNDFNNFVCDYIGTIDYVRTARRMMHCDRFDDNQKFEFACTYFFEDDIRRLWPLVSKNMNLNGIDFYTSPQLCYWTYSLRNTLDRIPSNEENTSVDEVMFEANMPQNGPSLQYFWNRMPLQNRLRRAFVIFSYDKLSFARFILPKLDDQQLEEFVNVGSYELISILFKNFWYDKELIWPAWMYIKKAINVDGLTKLVVNMLQNELMECPDDTFKHGDLKYRIWIDLCCEIWISAPENLKRSTIVEITSNRRLLSHWFIRSNVVLSGPYVPKEFKFLSTFLSNATSTERRRFWFDYWEILTEHVRFKYLEKIMKRYFENEDEIAEFKENVMANSDTACRNLLYRTRFDQLNEFANFLRSDIQASRRFKQQILRLAFLGRDGNEFNDATICKTKEFNKFIEDAFANVDLSTDFKNQLTSSPDIQRKLWLFVPSVPYGRVVEFIDTFVSTEETLLEIKERIIDSLKQDAIICKLSKSEFYHTPLLLWCLGSQEEVAKFKENHL